MIIHLKMTIYHKIGGQMNAKKNNRGWHDDG